MHDPDDPDHLPECGPNGCAGCPIALAERQMDAAAARLAERQRAADLAIADIACDHVAGAPCSLCDAERRRTTAATPANPAERSRDAAIGRVRAAMEHVETAQRELGLAAQDLCAVTGLGDQHRGAMTLYERVHRLWYRLDDVVGRARQAPVRDLYGPFMLDGNATPAGDVRPDEHPHRGCGGRTGGPAAHGLSKIAAAAAVALALASGCDFDTGGCQGDQCPLDAPPEDAGGDAGDGDTDAPPPPDAPLDAPTGDLPLDAECVPLADRCAPGLTCRLRGSSTGRCRPIGPQLAGDACAAEDECGQYMACVPDAAMDLRCFLICEVANPLIRCSVNQTCVEFPQPGTPTGLCFPP